MCHTEDEGHDYQSFIVSHPLLVNKLPFQAKAFRDITVLAYTTASASK